MNNATPTLLYIDDDAALARLVDRGLTRHGFKVVHAAGGQQGLERLAQGGIDVIALDQYMPGLDGLETLEQILEIPDAPPVVFVTASQDSAIAVTALKAGAADYLVKDVRAISSRCSRSPSTARCGRRKFRRPATRPKPRSMPRATAMRRSPPSARCCCARSTTASATLCRSSPRCCTCRPIRRRQEDVKAALTNAMGRVAAVAQVHRRLYTSHDLKSVLLNQYLEALLEDLRRSAEGNKMSRLTLKAEPIEIDPDRAVAIGIIVNELVMNAVKYAYPDGAGPIHVELKAQGDDLVLSISDDGVGLDDQGRSAFHRHGPAHRLGDGVQARSERRARSRAQPAPASCCGFAASDTTVREVRQRRGDTLPDQSAATAARSPAALQNRSRRRSGRTSRNRPCRYSRCRNTSARVRWHRARSRPSVPANRRTTASASAPTGRECWCRPQAPPAAPPPRAR